MKSEQEGDDEQVVRSIGPLPAFSCADADRKIFRRSTAAFGKSIMDEPIPLGKSKSLNTGVASGHVDLIVFVSFAGNRACI